MTRDDPGDGGPEEYPTDDEVPDDPIEPTDVSPFSVESDGFDDIDEFATAEWKSSTTADERIRAVIKRTTSPKTAKEIAATAAVSENKARTALNKLTEEGTVRSHRSATGKTYERDPEWHLLQQVHRLAKAGNLVDRIQRIKREIAEYRSRYGTEAPEDVLISDRELTAEELTDISHWRTANREFNYLRAAYRFEQARVADERVDESTGGPEPDPNLLQ